MQNNFSATPPIAFAAKNCQLIATVPNGVEEYWSADIKAVRHGVLNKVFTDVLFIEKPGELAFLAGIESQDGVDRHIRPDAALKQAEFISFLRSENDRNSAALGILARVFQGHDYAVVGKATAAYMAARSLSHAFGVGYVDQNGDYQTIQIVPGDDSGFDGNAYLPFDQLGENS
ncbi:hypothetical protein [Pseudomonas brassicacearum]|jgi:hypothetical protein|uniref:hypothetical protein n=1 Tax=Pseudomonas brassicacearum TaxID=930166 RepID=UPI0006408EF2|nr:hypothetical protein [Pseudomonas brassicacearum]